MRYAFGLVSLLVVVGIMMWVFSMTEIPKAKKGQEVREQIQPWTGKTADGQRAQDSIKMDGETNGGNLNDLLVTDVTPGGYYEQNFGLKKGDKILQIGDIDVGTLGDEGVAEAKVWEAGMAGSLTVLRNGQKLTLHSSDGISGGGRSPSNAPAAAPAPGAAPARPAAAPPAAAPAAPASPAAPAQDGQTIPLLPGRVRIPQIPQPE